MIMDMRRTFKKVINQAPASVGASTQQYILAQGVDNISPGQGGATDVTVPTGSHIKTIVVQFPIANLLASSLVVHVAVQYILGGQTAINANVVGGNAQRNQVIHQFVRSIGQFQNANIGYVIKIPKRFQRLKEGMQWIYTVTTNATATQTGQFIYTFES